jgi:hypothetical protein
MSYNSRWFGLFTRSEKRTQNNLGIVPYGLSKDAERKFRAPILEVLDSYYEGRQYDHLPDWEQCEGSDGSFFPARKRKPMIQQPFAKIFCERVTAKLVGDEVFPSFHITDQADDTELFKAVAKSAKLQWRILEPTRRLLASGSVFVRFFLSGGQIKIEHYLGKYCYPTFNDQGDLDSLTIKYVYEDKADKDSHGDPKQKWFRMDLSTVDEILFDNPEYKKDQEPEFNEVSRVEHGMGFVQGEWFRTMELKDTPDGPSLIHGALTFIDEMNYSLTQSSQAIGYNQDPQLILRKMDEDEVSTMIRSSSKAWNLGREGEAEFLESNLSGVERALEMRDKVRTALQDTCRVVLLDPEKVVASAQSGKAMEVLHGPMVELINELRPMIEDRIKSLLTKMVVSCLIANKAGIDIPITIPPGYVPQSLDLEITWPPVFQQTITDLRDKVLMVLSATNASLISRETGTRFLAKDFNIEDVEAEIAKVAAQPVLNPFGAF